MADGIHFKQQEANLLEQILASLLELINLHGFQSSIKGVLCRVTTPRERRTSDSRGMNARTCEGSRKYNEG